MNVDVDRFACLEIHLSRAYSAVRRDPFADAPREKIGENMVVKFMVDIPWRERFRILWHGRVFVNANYRGQDKPLRVEIGAVDPKQHGDQDKAADV